MFAGVDACKGGWIVAKSASWPCREVPALAVCSDFRTMLALTADCRRVAVALITRFAGGDSLSIAHDTTRK